LKAREFWRAKRAGGLIACAVTTLALSQPAAAPDRQALWRVVQACVADAKLTGAPFPCLKVDLSEGKDRGHVILRPPFGRADLILSPTRKVVGVEDPWLQSPDAPNYFEAALQARSFLKGPDGKPPQLGEIALAVNSAVSRSQDQLHFHIGCLTPTAKRALAVVAPGLPAGEWARLGGGVPGLPPLGYRVGAGDLAGVDPFRLAAEGLTGNVHALARLPIAVAGVRVGDHDDLVILAAPGAFSAESIIDSSCSDRSSGTGSK